MSVSELPGARLAAWLWGRLARLSQRGSGHAFSNFLSVVLATPGKVPPQAPALQHSGSGSIFRILPREPTYGEKAGCPGWGRPRQPGRQEPSREGCGLGGRGPKDERPFGHLLQWRTSWCCRGEGPSEGPVLRQGRLGARVLLSPQSMARLLRLCTWLLALGPGLLATVRAECSQDCATCSYRLVRPADINFLACTLECEGKLPSLKIWETCKELLQLSKPELPQDGLNTLRESGKQEEGHLLAKKYGGFMKRYGGFMKKMDELYPGEPEEEANGGEILAKRYGGFMKKDAGQDDSLANSSDLLKELLGTGDNQESSHHQEGSDNDEEMSKRYGGFMRGLKRSPQLDDEAKELQKRYGGFMRRVGRPEWWMDYQKRYGGFLKRFAEALPSDEEGESYSKEVPEMEKRYGGFMRF